MEDDNNNNVNSNDNNGNDGENGETCVGSRQTTTTRTSTSSDATLMSTIQEERGEDPPFTLFSTITFSSWWSWWFPLYVTNWWKPHGLSRSDFTIGKSPFAGGSHGEVWKGRRVCRKVGDDNDVYDRGN